MSRLSRIVLTVAVFLGLLVSNVSQAVLPAQPDNPQPRSAPLQSQSALPASAPARPASSTVPVFNPAPAAFPNTAQAPKKIPDPRHLPDALTGLQELTNARTANSATFKNGSHYTSIVAEESMHYRDELGKWQVINPTFVATDKGYVVERNSIHSRVGLVVPSIAASAGQTIVNWQATELGISHGADFVPLAHAMTEAATPAQQKDNGRTLSYTGSWSDPRLLEEVTSAPDALEQSLIMTALPAVPTASEGKWLELRASLKLLPNTVVWANGQAQSAEFATQGAIELHDSQGHVSLAFDPVRAFEQDHPEIAVTGEYVARPVPVGDAKGQAWSISLRTPLAWWTDPARSYPSVIDPKMRVLQTTASFGASADSHGIAWVPPVSWCPFIGVCDTTDGQLRVGEMLLGSSYQTSQYRGYLQFNQMPYLLTNNPTLVSKATLEVEPSGLLGPSYHYDDDHINWYSFNNMMAARLIYLPACSNTTCADFTLSTTLPGFNWGNTPSSGSTPQDSMLFTPIIDGVNKGQTIPTDWDVTAHILNWANRSPRPAQGPMFMLKLLTPHCNAYPQDTGASGQPVFSLDQNFEILNCTRLAIQPKDVRLIIEYTALQMHVGDTVLNSPGVPSYNPDLFDDGHGLSQSHQYELAPQGTADPHWRAVAVKPNHALTPTLNGQTGLKLTYYPDPNSENKKVDLGHAGSNAGDVDDIEWALIDDHNTTASPATANAWLKADVTAAELSPLNYPTDGQRNYRIDYAAGLTIDVPYSQTVFQTVMFDSGRLIQLRELALREGDSFQISMTVPLSLSLDVALATPTAGTDKPGSAIRFPKGGYDTGLLLGDAFGQYTTANNKILNFTATYMEASGDYALTLINTGRPTPMPPPRNDNSKSFPVTIQLLRCPVGTIPTARYKCQPIIAPRPTTASMPALSLTVYSEGGFTGSGSNWCTKDEANGTPIIGPSTAHRWTAVAQGSVCFDGVTLSTTIESGVLLITQTLPLTDSLIHGVGPFGFSYGDTSNYPLPPGMQTGVVTRTAQSLDRLVPTSNTRRNVDPFRTHWQMVTTHRIDLISTADVAMYGTDVISVPVAIAASSAATRTQWLASWRVYPDEAVDPDKLFSFDYHDIQSPVWPTPIDMASMDLRLLDPVTGTATIFDYDKNSAGVRVDQFRTQKARITQPAELGAASKSVEAIVLPPGESRYTVDGHVANCGAENSCFDLYDGAYQWLDDIVPWLLPDVHVINTAGSVVLSRDNQVLLFSKDHPDSKLTPSGVSSANSQFSFDTYGVQVTVAEEPCESGRTPVTVIHGVGKMGLPMLGDDGSSGDDSSGVTVDFRICKSALHDAQLTLNIHPADLPIGSTGLGAYMVDGHVLVNSAHTVVSFTLGFESLDKELLTGGYGTVTIDTYGMFDLKAGATIISIIHADTELLIAWNPLDVLIDAEASCCGGLISGGLKLEGWVGQGWQHKYQWLPNDDSFHFNGSIKAELKIPEDYISDFLDLPPATFVIAALTISFGDFCDNDACSKTTAGMSVVVTIIGIDIGLYIDSSGPDFIFGSDDHVLASEYQSSNIAAPEVSLPNKPLTATFQIQPPGLIQVGLAYKVKSSADDWKPLLYDPCTAHGTLRTCPFTVKTSAGRAAFIAQWRNGDLDVSLIRPDGQLITPGNAAALGISVTVTRTRTLGQTMYEVRPVGSTPIMTGVWKIQLGNVGRNLRLGIKNNYKIMFFTDPAPPQLNWIAPTQTITVENGSLVNLQWTAFRPGNPLTSSTKLELFYTPVLSKPVDPNQMVGLPIVNQYTATLGTYSWDTSGLAAGAYAFGAQIDDHLNANGAPVFWSSGVIVITDTTPPPAPVLFGTTTITDGLIVTWHCENTPDLAGYLVAYTIPDWNLSAPQVMRARRVLPHSCSLDVPYLPAEHVRLGGLNGAHFMSLLCISAYDASGNIGAATCEHEVNTTAPVRPMGTPIRFDAHPDAVSLPRGGLGPAIQAIWGPPSGGPAAAGYLLSYAPTGCLLPDVRRTAVQGTTPISVGDVLSYTLTGLTPGQVYHIGVSAYSNKFVFGPEASKDVMFINPTDSNSDGLPDQWAALYGITSPSADPDRDLLTNLQEYQYKTDPNNADSDGDGYYDREELNADTPPCGLEHPLYHTHPKLTVKGKGWMSFHAAINEASPAMQSLYIYNFGGGTMNWTATPSAPWIVVDNNQGTGNGTLKIGVSPLGLAPGTYSGQVTIDAFEAAGTGLNVVSASDALTETTFIDVQFEVLPTKQFDLFLPLVIR